MTATRGDARYALASVGAFYIGTSIVAAAEHLLGARGRAAPSQLLPELADLLPVAVGAFLMALVVPRTTRSVMLNATLVTLFALAWSVTATRGADCSMGGCGMHWLAGGLPAVAVAGAGALIGILGSRWLSVRARRGAFAALGAYALAAGAGTLLYALAPSALLAITAATAVILLGAAFAAHEVAQSATPLQSTGIVALVVLARGLSQLETLRIGQLPLVDQLISATPLLSVAFLFGWLATASLIRTLRSTQYSAPEGQT